MAKNQTRKFSELQQLRLRRQNAILHSPGNFKDLKVLVSVCLTGRVQKNLNYFATHSGSHSTLPYARNWTRKPGLGD